MPYEQGYLKTYGFTLRIKFMILSFQARSIFDQLCPGEEFLPKAPNPEDIIFDDGAQPNTEGSGFESEKKSEEGGNTEQPAESEGSKSEEPSSKTADSEESKPESEQSSS